MSTFFHFIHTISAFSFDQRIDQTDYDATSISVIFNDSISFEVDEGRLKRRNENMWTESTANKFKRINKNPTFVFVVSIGCVEELNALNVVYVPK